jgi:hypothetical protein
MTGYHIENLAVEIFKRYQGRATLTEMLPYFFEQAQGAVFRPIRDRTGQSRHVDDYLGPGDSAERRELSNRLGRVARSMRNATAGQSRAQWEAIFGIDE